MTTVDLLEVVFTFNTRSGWRKGSAFCQADVVLNQKSNILLAPHKGVHFNRTHGLLNH